MWWREIYSGGKSDRSPRNNNLVVFKQENYRARGEVLPHYHYANAASGACATVQILSGEGGEKWEEERGEGREGRKEGWRGGMEGGRGGRRERGEEREG